MKTEHDFGSSSSKMSPIHVMGGGERGGDGGGKAGQNGFLKKQIAHTHTHTQIHKNKQKTTNERTKNTPTITSTTTTTTATEFTSRYPLNDTWALLCRRMRTSLHTLLDKRRVVPVPL